MSELIRDWKAEKRDLEKAFDLIADQLVKAEAKIRKLEEMGTFAPEPYTPENQLKPQGQYPVQSTKPEKKPRIFMTNIIRIDGPETAFVAELLTVIERHAAELTVHQICGGLFAAAHEVLQDAQI